MKTKNVSYVSMFSTDSSNARNENFQKSHVRVWKHMSPCFNTFFWINMSSANYELRIVCESIWNCLFQTWSHIQMKNVASFIIQPFVSRWTCYMLWQKLSPCLIHSTKAAAKQLCTQKRIMKKKACDEVLCLKYTCSLRMIFFSFSAMELQSVNIFKYHILLQCHISCFLSFHRSDRMCLLYSTRCS